MTKSAGKDQLKVKVCMIAYNQERFLEESIKGVLNQRAPFDIELVIGEDCSTDKTRSICEKFAAKWPDKINLLPSKKNLGIQDNFFRTLDVCIDADYVAFCEGDDKWVDNDKLAHQINFLEKNKNFVAHSHNVICRDIRGEDDSDSNFGELIDKACSEEELFTGWPFHVVSLVVRGALLKSIPVGSLPKFISGDKFLNRWISCHGDLFYEGSRSMAVYHRHSYGASEAAGNPLREANYLSLRYQELGMLEFFENYSVPNEIMNKEKISAVEDIALFWAERRVGKKHNSLKLAVVYIKLIQLKSRSDYYYLLLILFGRFFLLFHRKIKHILNVVSIKGLK